MSNNITKSLLEQFTCDFCKKTFITETEAIFHVKEHSCIHNWEDLGQYISQSELVWLQLTYVCSKCNTSMTIEATIPMLETDRSIFKREHISNVMVANLDHATDNQNQLSKLEGMLFTTLVYRDSDA